MGTPMADDHDAPTSVPGPLCVFCEIVYGREPATYHARLAGCTCFEPLNPVTPGHLLVIPDEHVPHALAQPWITGKVFEIAARIARDFDTDVNLITSAGWAATQTIDHFHVHIVPRREGDGLHLPWTDQTDGGTDG
jgi:histidine triad (HIT) family protein